MRGVAYKLGRVAVGLYEHLMLDVDVVWHVPLARGPKVFAMNHPSTSDPVLMLAVIPEPMSVLITEMCFRAPGLGGYLHSSGHIPVVDGDGRAAFEEARRRLGQGRSVGIFPEGALSPLDGSLGRARTGAVRLALSTGTPIIPIGISLWREHLSVVEMTVAGKTELARWYLRGPYAVTVGNPIRLAGDVEDREQVGLASRRLMQCIGELAAESARRIDARASWQAPAPRRPIRLAAASRISSP